MTIGYFIASSDLGGAEKVVMDLCNAMSKTHQVHFITFLDDSKLSKLNKRVHIHQIKKFGRISIFPYLKLVKLINGLSLDIIHTHSVKATVIIYRISRFLSPLHVATKHNARKGKIFNRLKYVIAVSEDVKKSIASEREARVIYNGIEPVHVSSSHREDTAVRFLAIGRLDPIKGFDRLIEACAKLSRPFFLDIVGEGSHRNVLEEKIADLNLQAKVRLLGFKEDIPQRMADADCVVMSSYSEGFSVVMVESLFYARCFISTKVSGATEILPEMFLTEQASLADKLESFMQKRAVYQKAFGSLATSLRPSFLLSKIAEDHLRYYEEVLENRGRRR